MSKLLPALVYVLYDLIDFFYPTLTKISRELCVKYNLHV